MLIQQLHRLATALIYDASADENSESLGKLYNNGIGTVLETTDNGWYKIQSGSVTGYVKGDYICSW